MNKEEIKQLEEINQRSKSNEKRINDHDAKIDKLENVYIALTKVDGRVEKVESDVGEIKKMITSHNPDKSKALKWDKLIDYMFYTVLAYCLYKLGIKK